MNISHMAAETDANSSVGQSIPHFNETQLHVMQILWDAGAAVKPAQIEEQFSRPIENATLRSVLKVLVEKGEVHREKVGKAYLYSPVKEKRRTLSQFFGGLADVFSAGSRAGLVAQLLQDESFSEEELEELMKLARKGKYEREDGK